VRWYDSTGALVGPQLTWIDSTGVLWPLDVETGGVSVSLMQRLTFVYFAEADCSGEAFYAAPVPRMAVTVNDELGARVRWEQVVSVVLPSLGYRRWDASTCIGAVQTVRAVRLTDLTPLVSVPVLPYVGPLHPELR